ncbi:MAG: right-handed parallel beta-helix repeat-containing protein [bacterium]
MVVRIRVDVAEGDIVGRDNRAIQAAVDYVANLGGGIVEVGPGEFLMEDSLHLRSHVTVRGQGESTVLRKCDGFRSRLVLDGDYGEERVTVSDPSGFKVGMGISLSDDGVHGFHVSVATIVGIEENTLLLNKPLLADCMVQRNAAASNAFPVISGYYLDGAAVENIVVDGNGAVNDPLTGCRGAGIFLYRAHGTRIADCIARNFNGDGISFQQSDDVVVENCICTGNTQLGLHPGSGSQRPVIRNCRSFRNGQIGLFLCWRVRHGLFEGNEICENGKIGISIGHKDSDNVFKNNLIEGNGKFGIYFRDESEPMGGHRNLIEGNRILNNGGPDGGYGIYIDGETHDIVIRDNEIIDTHPPEEKVQKVGVFVGPKADRITIRGNRIEGSEINPG